MACDATLDPSLFYSQGLGDRRDGSAINRTDKRRGSQLKCPQPSARRPAASSALGGGRPTPDQVLEVEPFQRILLPGAVALVLKQKGRGRADNRRLSGFFLATPASSRS